MGLTALLFTNRMMDMRTRNWAHPRKAVNLSPVSSTLPKDGLPAPRERVFFACTNRDRGVIDQAAGLLNNGIDL